MAVSRGNSHFCMGIVRIMFISIATIPCDITGHGWGGMCENALQCHRVWVRGG